MADTGGFFGPNGWFARHKPPSLPRLLGFGSESSRGVGFAGTNFPTLPQAVHRGVEALTGNPYGGGPPRSLMNSAESGQQEVRTSGLPDSGATVTPYSGPQIGGIQQPQQDNGWRTGEGGTGLGGGWSTLSNNAMASMMDGLGPSGTGSLAGSGDAVRFRMQPEFGVELTGPNGQQRTRGGDSRTMQHGPLMSSATAQDFIRDNPEQWAQMQRRMRERG